MRSEPGYPDWLKQMHEKGKAERKPENLKSISEDKTGEAQRIAEICKQYEFTESPAWDETGVAVYYIKLKTGLFKKKIISPEIFERFASKHSGISALKAQQWLQSVAMLEGLMNQGLYEKKINREMFDSFVNDIGNVEVESIFLRLCTEYKVCLEWPLGGPSGEESANSGNN